MLARIGEYGYESILVAPLVVGDEEFATRENRVESRPRPWNRLFNQPDLFR
jgi:hypothetical protein